MTEAQKRAFVNRYCYGMNCGACKLRNASWSVVASGCNCLDIDLCPESDLDHAIELIGDTVLDAETVTEDPVNSPSHYNKGDIECIDAIKASMYPEEYAGFLKGQVIKYVWRYLHKGKPVEDLKKARYYLDKLIQVAEEVIG